MDELEKAFYERTLRNTLGRLITRFEWKRVMLLGGATSVIESMWVTEKVFIREHELTLTVSACKLLDIPRQGGRTSEFTVASAVTNNQGQMYLFPLEGEEVREKIVEHLQAHLS